MRFGPTIENMNLIAEKAKLKKDGVYSFRGVTYRVRSGRVTHIAHDSRILERCGNFNVQIGNYGIYRANAIKALKSIK